MKAVSMKLNVGGFDKRVRIVVGLGLLALVFVLQGSSRWFGLIGVVPLATGLIGYCPLCSPFGLSPCSAKTKLA
jgi:DUF2892 family protein